MANTTYPKVGGATTDVQYAELFDAIVGTGVRDTGDLAVSASSGLVLSVAAGFAVVNGVAFKATSANTVTLGAANATNARVDTVVLIRDAGNASGPVYIGTVAGTAAASPVPATLTQSLTGIWQEPLAYVTVAANASSVSAGNIVDARRYLKERVGVWATTTRPTARIGKFGYNTTLGAWEGYTGSTWAPLSADWNTLANKPATFTPSAHTHAGTDIASGAVAVANGGTGATTNTQARSNLGLGSISTLNSVSLTSNVTGLLPIASGGTGAAAAIDARANLGLGALATLSTVTLGTNTTGTLPVSQGGTGATDAATARANLGISTSGGTQITDGTSYLQVGNDGNPRLWTNPDLIYNRSYTGTGYGGTDAHLMVITAAGTIGTLHAPLDPSYIPTLSGSKLVSSPSFSGVVAMNSGITSDNVRARAVSSNYVSVYVEGDGRFGYNSSSRDTKHDIEPLTETITPEQVLSIEPKTFVYNHDETNTVQVGMIAEDVQDAGLGHIVPVDADGKPITINYEHFVAPLLMVVRDQNEQIKALTERVIALEGK